MTASPSAATVLKIDESRTVEQIAADLRRIHESRHTGGLLMGLSGGLDSAVLSTLVVHTLGKEALHVCFLRERHSETDSERKARLMAEWLDLELEIEDISEAIRQRGLYSPLIMRLIGLSRFLNRHVIHGAHRLVSGETPFMTTLRQDKFKDEPIKRFFYNLTVRKVEGAFNGRQLHRREVLEKKARQRNALMIGAGNRSEVLTGWFVKDGVDDFPHSPLAGLYKTQVCQLARYLDLPREIIDQPPSPDLMRGVTDEVALGLDYDRIDLVLDALERDRPDRELIAAGLTQPEIDTVREMNRRSEWKRNPGHPVPPTDGGIEGGLRVN
jgi:NAD+ synthase